MKILNFFVVLILLGAVASFASASKLFGNQIRTQNRPFRISSSSSSMTLTVTVNCSSTVGGELTATRDYIRSSLQPLTQNVVVTWEGEGCVAVAGTQQPVLELDGHLDSGTNGYTITWSGIQVRGGQQIPYNLWKPSTKVAGALMVDLSAAPFGMTNLSTQIGEFAAGSLGQCSGNRAELFVDSRPMSLARIPNAKNVNGPWMQWLNIAETDPSGSFFTSTDPALGVLANRPLTNTTVYAHGYWSFDWADSWVKILNISSTDGTTFTLFPDPTTLPVYGYSKSARFYLVNDISLLDSASEYIIDQDFLLHFLPLPSFGSASEVWISTNEAVLISQTGYVPLQNVNFENVDLRFGRADGLDINNGININLVDSKISCFGRSAGGFSGSNITIDSLKATQFGCRGMSINGGNTKTLQSSGNVFKNSDISYMGRIIRSYNPGMPYSGVGHQILNNTIHSGPHSGILGGGNNILIQGNTLHSLVYGSRDAGAFYTGRSWVERGTILKDNLFLNIRKVEPTFLGSELVVAIYWDDEMSGMTAINNRCEQVMGCLLLGGGRDNTFDNNICHSIDRHCVHFDNRGMNWQRAYCTPPNGPLVQGLFSVNYTQPPYSVEYPRIVNTVADRPCVPVGNSLMNNVCLNCSLGFVSAFASEITSWGSQASNNSGI